MKTLMIALLLTACTPTRFSPPEVPAPQISSTVTVTNETATAEVIYFAFGADSAVLPSAWSFCTATARLNCQFTIGAHASQVLPTPGYLNTTFAFGAQVSCGTTKAELNVNNPNWYDVADISLVDGYSNKIQIKVNDTLLGPPVGKEGNEKVLGVYPLGCDICTARQHPPCGMTPGKSGCKLGPDQYHPDVPCQFQGSRRGGGSKIIVSHVL